MSDASVVVPFAHSPSAAEVRWLEAILLQPEVGELVVVAPGEQPASLRDARVQHLAQAGQRGEQLRAGIGAARRSQVILQDPHPGYDPRDYTRLLEPLASGRADAVYGNRFGSSRSVGSYFDAIAEGGLRFLSNAVTNLDLTDPDSGLRAFGGETLRGLSLTSEGEGIDAEITFKIAAQFSRVYEVPLHYSLPPRRDSVARKLAEARTLLRYASGTNDADNLHEGYNTLLRMDGAPRYNAWLGKKLRAHLGQRVLEVGAGIGTITRQIERGREKVIALEVDKFYVDKLKNLFAQKPHVLPLLSGVEDADWDALAPHQIDSVLLSNVLEHIADDAQAVAQFKRLLPADGRLVILVPALPALFGTIDEAVGHYRRYTKASLRAVLENQGFRVEHMEWLNLVGVPGWFMNGRVFKRRAVPPVQLKLYDTLAPLLASIEDRFRMPLGMSLLAVGRA